MPIPWSFGVQLTTILLESAALSEEYKLLTYDTAETKELFKNLKGPLSPSSSESLPFPLSTVKLSDAFRTLQFRVDYIKDVASRIQTQMHQLQTGDSRARKSGTLDSVPCWAEIWENASEVLAYIRKKETENLLTKIKSEIKCDDPSAQVSAFSICRKNGDQLLTVTFHSRFTL